MQKGKTYIASQIVFFETHRTTDHIVSWKTLIKKYRKGGKMEKFIPVSYVFKKHTTQYGMRECMPD